MPHDILLVRLVVAHLDTLWAELIEHQRQRSQLTQEDRHHPPRPSVIALMVSVCAVWKCEDRGGLGAAFATLQGVNRAEASRSLA